ncbi:MAG: choice-of-anchor D domain-containing protein, partial [Myxococcales bacterium]
MGGPLMLRRTLPLCLATLAACSPHTSLQKKAATIDVSPNPILFQPLAVGKSAVVTVQVRNTGNLDLHLAKDPYVVEADNDGFTEYSTPITLAKDCEGADRKVDSRLTIVPGDCAVVIVRYSPLNTGDADTAALTFESDDPDHPTLAVPVQQGAPPHIQVCTIKENGADDVCDTPQTQPAQVEFGVVAQGQSKLNKVRLRNTGQVPLGSLIVYDPDGPMGPEFARSANAPTSLDVGAAVDVTVKFTPAGAGPRTGWMQVDSADPARPSVQVPLRGVTAGPALCADPSPLDFGQGTVGTAIQKDVKLTSCGNVAVNLMTIGFDVLSSPAFTPVTLPPPQAIPPGSSVIATIRFLPEDGSPARGALLVPNDAQPSQYVPLLGSALYPPACRLEASVAQVDFGQVVRGQSAQRDVTVANRGLADCSLTAVRITAGATFFSVIAPPTNPITLRSGDAFTSTLQYAPPANDQNASDSGTVEFDSNDPSRPQLTVMLTGSSVASPVCKIQVTPGVTCINPSPVGCLQTGRALQFGNVTVGKTKTLPATVSNVGSANCSISGAKLVSSIGGPVCLGGPKCGDYKITANALGSLPPGQSTQISVSYTPSSTDALPFGPQIFLDFHSGDSAHTSECTLGFPTDGTAGCVQLGMIGQGDISNLQILPSDLDFGLVTLGCRAQPETISLYNTGTSASITIKSITLDPTTAPFYVTAPPTPFSIAPQQKVQIQATYKPTAAQTDNASLRFETDASNTTTNNPYVTMALTGTGTTNSHQTDTFTQAAHPTVDMLMVMDNSGSMQDYQSSLSQQGPAFINQALQAGADFHFGVTTTENDQNGQKADSNSAYPGDPIYVGGLFGHPPIIDSTDTNAAADFSKNIRVGTCCSDERESGLESAWHVLTPNANQTQPPQGSLGFLRDEARLVMLVLSDEQDQSHGSTSF